MRTIMLTWAALLVVTGGSRAAAQAAAPDRSPGYLVRMAQPTKYEPPKCGLKAGHFMVSSGAAYLKTAVETTVPDNKGRALSNARRVLEEAIARNDQATNPAVWYFLGRVSLYEGDLTAADSSFTRAEALAPACQAEISSLRESAWLALVKPAGDQLKAEQDDSAKALYQAATIIYRGAPNAYRGLGIIYANSGMTDSAITYFQKAIESAKDPRTADIKSEAEYNLATMYIRAGRHAEAVELLRAFVAANPADADAKKLLASAFRRAGQPDSARAIESQLVTSGGAASSDDLAQIGATAFNDKRYDEAAKAFARILETAPYDHDALYNLANSYVGLKDGPNLVATAERLIALEPLNHYVSSMLGRGYQLVKKTDRAVAVLKDAEAQAVNIEAGQFRPGLGGATLEGEVRGRAPKTLEGKALKAAPTTVVFEFIDKTGSPVSTQTLTFPVLADGESQPLKVEGKGAGIVSWRYRRQ